MMSGGMKEFLLPHIHSRCQHPSIYFQNGCYMDMINAASFASEQHFVHCTPDGATYTIDITDFKYRFISEIVRDYYIYSRGPTTAQVYVWMQAVE